MNINFDALSTSKTLELPNKVQMSRTTEVFQGDDSATVSRFEVRCFEVCCQNLVHLKSGSIEMTYLLLTQAPWFSFSAFPKIFLLILLRFIDGTA